jgi:hypothetical protein
VVEEKERQSTTYSYHCHVFRASLKVLRLSLASSDWPETYRVDESANLNGGTFTLS